MFKKLVILIPAILIPTVDMSANEFQKNRSAKEVYFKYSKHTDDIFSKELGKFGGNVKFKNGLVFGGDVGVFEDSDLLYNLYSGYRIHINRDTYIQGQIGYRYYDFDEAIGTDDSMDIKYGNIIAAHQFNRDITYRLGIERNFPNSVAKNLGLDKSLDYFGEINYRLVDNIHVGVNYHSFMKDVGIHINWKF